MSTRYYNQFIFTMRKKAILADCNFIVDSTNGNGLGIRSLKGPEVAEVFMHTSSTPATGNPNPAPGYIIVRFKQNYLSYLGGFTGFVSPLSGSSISISTGSSLTEGDPYIITAVGSTTQAQWEAVGVLHGQKAQPGLAFIATATSGSGTGTVQAPSNSGIVSLEVLGNSNLALAQVNPGEGQILLQCLAPTFTYDSGTPADSTVTLAPTAPANGSVIGMTFYFNDSYAPPQ